MFETQQDDDDDNEAEEEEEGTTAAFRSFLCLPDCIYDPFLSVVVAGLFTLQHPMPTRAAENSEFCHEFLRYTVREIEQLAVLLDVRMAEGLQCLSVAFAGVLHAASLGWISKRLPA